MKQVDDVNTAKSIPPITSEEDEPLEPTPSNLSEKELGDKRVSQLEKTVTLAERFQIVQIKEKAYKLILIIFIALTAMFITDTIVINLGGKSSEMLSSLFELLKISVSTLIGFLFANKIEK